MKRIFALLLCAAMLLVYLPATVSAATIVTRAELTLDYPLAGNTPPTTASVNGNGYSVYSIDWYDRTGSRFLESGEKFQADHQYRATVWVEAKSGYEFSHADSKTPAITGYINGTEVSVSKAYEYNAWAMVCLDYYFSSTPQKGWIKTVNLTVPAPEAGESPSYTRLTGTGYGTGNVSFSGSTNEKMKNGVAWSPVGEDYLKPGQDSFAENTAYELHCLVFPEDGYRIREDAVVYVNGKQAEAKLDYDTFLAVNYVFPATGTIAAAHTHTPSPWRSTGIYHYKVCTECGEFLEQEDHYGGTATCTEKAKCQVCGTAYGQNEPDHKWSPTYLYKDKTGHAWVCADCKEHSTIEKHDPGPAATETKPQTCKDCGYIIEPAKNHKHDLTKVPQTPATCIEEGNIEYYFCTGCNDCFTDAEGANKIPETMSVTVGALGHTVSEDWGIDETYHWRVCTTCNQVIDETKMLHDEENGKCTTCNYVFVDHEILPEATEPAGGNQPGDDSWVTILLVGLVCFAAAITTTVIVLKMKKKRGEAQ